MGSPAPKPFAGWSSWAEGEALSPTWNHDAHRQLGLCVYRRCYIARIRFRRRLRGARLAIGTAQASYQEITRGLSFEADRRLAER